MGRNEVTEAAAYLGRSEVRLPWGHSRPCVPCLAASADSSVLKRMYALSRMTGIHMLSTSPAFFTDNTQLC